MRFLMLPSNSVPAPLGIDLRIFFEKRKRASKDTRVSESLSAGSGK